MRVSHRANGWSDLLGLVKELGSKEGNTQANLIFKGFPSLTDAPLSVYYERNDHDDASECIDKQTRFHYFVRGSRDLG